MTDTVYVLDEAGYPRPKPIEKDEPMTATIPKKNETKAKPKASKPKPVAKKASAASTNRWTESDVKLLEQAVKQSPTHKAAFESVSKELGKSTGTIQQKWYNLQKKSGKPSKRAARSTGPVTPGNSQRRSGSSTGSENTSLRMMDNTELANLAQAVVAEVSRRRSELERAAAMFR